MIEIVRVSLFQTGDDGVMRDAPGRRFEFRRHRLRQQAFAREACIRGVMQPGKCERFAAPRENFFACRARGCADA